LIEFGVNLVVRVEPAENAPQLGYVDRVGRPACVSG
jgi:hypothetical protein